MRWTHFFLIQILLIVMISGIAYLHKDKVGMTKIPPASLAQWYKPENKRQVWLHNMFKLRREMQAVQFYAEHKDAPHLKKWLTQLNMHYLKIGKMVPEWQSKLNMEVMDELQRFAKNNQYKNVSKALDSLTTNCNSCHADYRTITAMIYRAPNFAEMKINSSTSFKEHMQELTQQINQIKIATEDGLPETALATLSDLKEGMAELGQSCSTCHKKDIRLYPDATMKKTIISLQKNLKTGTLKAQGRDLGTLAVLACARCHGTHRIAYDTRKQFIDGPNWLDLIKH